MVKRMTERNTEDRSQPGQGPTPIAGWCEAASRLMGVVLSSPQAKARVHVLLSHIDPDYAPHLIRVFLRTDPELALSTLSALPRLANVFIESLAEISRLIGTYPPALLGQVTSGLVSQLRARPLGEALGRGARLALDLPLGSGDPAAFWSELARGFEKGYESCPQTRPTTEQGALSAHARGLAAFVAEQAERRPERMGALAGFVGEILKAHPALVTEVLLPMLEPLHQALHRAEPPWPGGDTGRAHMTPGAKGEPT